jgi:hypothetical protein
MWLQPSDQEDMVRLLANISLTTVLLVGGGHWIAWGEVLNVLMARIQTGV